jgi:ribosomal protein L44E
MANNEKEKNEKEKPMVWTCTECGGHYLIMPVIVGQEYSVDEEGQEYWGDIIDEDSKYVFEEEKGKTHAFCKICNKETLCELRPFKPAPINGPNLIKNAEQINDANLKNAPKNMPEDAVLE